MSIRVQAARGLRGDDERLVAAGDEVFGDAQDAMRDAVDVGRERLRNDGNPHAHKVRYQQIAASQAP